MITFILIIASLFALYAGSKIAVKLHSAICQVLNRLIIVGCALIAILLVINL